MRVTSGDKRRASIDAPVEPLPLAADLGLSHLVHDREVESTMDVVHAMAAAGAPAGLLVLADRQRRGRGRSGTRWHSAEPTGLWFTLLERPADPRIISVLSLRLGLALAEALRLLVDSPLQLKWPNDVVSGDGKIAGILVEARWRESILDWVAIGIGINQRVPNAYPNAACVRTDVTRSVLLHSVVPRIRAAAAALGHLSNNERDEWQRRDVARGRRIVAPCEGIVAGVAADGALLVTALDGGSTVAVRTGSMEFHQL